MGILDKFRGAPKPDYRYITQEPLENYSDHIPEKSILAYFKLNFALAPNLPELKKYLEKSARGWKLERYHAYLEPAECGMFTEVDVMVENARTLITLSRKPDTGLDLQELLNWVVELHSNFGEDAFERTGLEPEDERITDPEQWEAEPFWQGRRWPASPNSPEFELKLDDIQGLICQIWK